jgi:hypothetical protein
MPETRNKLETWALAVKKSLYHGLKPARKQEQQRLFVAGMQRSGTNLVMEVIEHSLSTDVYHEYDVRAFKDYKMRSPDEIEQLVARSRAEHFVIKSLCELDELSELMDRFEPARTVWIVRRCDDVVNSMLRSFKNMAAQVHRIMDDKDDEEEWLAHGMTDDTYERVAACVGEDLTDGDASALQWYFRNMLFFNQGFEQDDRVCLVFYEDLVTQPEVEFGRVFAFAGIDFRSDYVSKVSTRSIRKNQPPQLSEPVQRLCDELYKRFQAVK